MTAIETRESAGDESKVGSTQPKATMKAQRSAWNKCPSRTEGSIGGNRGST